MACHKFLLYFTDSFVFSLKWRLSISFSLAVFVYISLFFCDFFLVDLFCK